MKFEIRPVRCESSGVYTGGHKDSQMVSDDKWEVSATSSDGKWDVSPRTEVLSSQS